MNYNKFNLALALPILLLSNIFCGNVANAKDIIVESNKKFESLPKLDFDWFNANAIIVDATIDGHPVRALIDTGFPNAALDAGFAKSIGKDFVYSGRGYSVGGETNIGIINGLAIDIGGVKIQNEKIDIFDLKYIKEKLGISFDVIIGASALRNLVVNVNFDNKTVQFGAPVNDDGKGIVLPFVLNDKNRMITQITVNNVMVDRMIIDTGASNDLEIEKPIFDKIAQSVDSVTDALSYGPGGELIEPMFTADSVKIGNQNIKDVIVDVENDGFISHSEGNGSLNLGLLSRYNFIIDGPDSRIILNTRKTAYAVKPKSSVGVQVNYLSSEIEIVHVMRGSPAEKAGIKKGDIICAVDGVEVNDGWKNSPMRQWTTVAPSHNYSINLCSGKTIKLTTAQFY